MKLPVGLRVTRWVVVGIVVVTLAGVLAVNVWPQLEPAPVEVVAADAEPPMPPPAQPKAGKAAVQGRAAKPASPLPPVQLVAAAPAAELGQLPALPATAAQPEPVVVAPAAPVSHSPVSPMPAAPVAAAPPPAVAPVAVQPAAAPPAVNARVQQAITERNQNFTRMAEQRTALVAERLKLENEATQLRQRQAARQVEIAKLNNDADNLQLGIDQIEQSIAGSFAIGTNGRNSSRTSLVVGINQMRAQQRLLLAQLNQTNANLQKATLAAQEIPGLMVANQQKMESLARQAEQLRADWLKQLALFELRTPAEHEADVTLFTALLAKDDQNSGALVGRGLAYWRLGKLDDAMVDLKRAVDVDNGFAGIARAARGALLTRAGKSREGVSDFAQAAKLDRNSAEVFLFRGVAEAGEGRYAPAEREFMQAVQLSGHSDAYRLLALLYASWPGGESVHAKKALENAERACDLTSNNDWSCLLALAAAQATAGDFADAVKTIDKAVEVAPLECRDLCRQQQKRYAAQQRCEADWK